MSEQENEILQQLVKSQKRMELAILGDEELKIPGLVHKVAKHEAYIAAGKKRKWIFMGTAIGSGMTLPQLLNYLKTFF